VPHPVRQTVVIENVRVLALGVCLRLVDALWFFDA